MKKCKYILIMFFFVVLMLTGCFAPKSKVENQYEEITILLDNNGGNGGTSSVKVPKIPGQTPSLPQAIAPTREDYIFKGYYINKNGSGQQYYTSKMTGFKSWNLTSSRTLYARWLPKDINYESITLDSMNIFNYLDNDETLGNAYWYNFKPLNEDLATYTETEISFTFVVDVYEGYKSTIAKRYSFDIVLSRQNNFTTGRVLVFKNSEFSNKTLFYDTKIINVSGNVNY